MLQAPINRSKRILPNLWHSFSLGLLALFLWPAIADLLFAKFFYESPLTKGVPALILLLFVGFCYVLAMATSFRSQILKYSVTAASFIICFPIVMMLLGILQATFDLPCLLAPDPIFGCALQGFRIIALLPLPVLIGCGIALGGSLLWGVIDTAIQIRKFPKSPSYSNKTTSTGSRLYFLGTIHHMSPAKKALTIWHLLSLLAIGAVLLRSIISSILYAPALGYFSATILVPYGYLSICYVVAISSSYRSKFLQWSLTPISLTATAGVALYVYAALRDTWGFFCSGPWGPTSCVSDARNLLSFWSAQPHVVAIILALFGLLTVGVIATLRSAKKQ